MIWGPEMTARPTYLADNERMLVACLRVIAARIARETRRMPEDDAVRTASGEVLAEVRKLGGVSTSFAAETIRYLGDQIRRDRCD